MTKPFVQTWKVALTPLSPLHLGAGEDYVPTNYVIVNGVLYHFEPSSVPLTPAMRRDLVAAANSGRLAACAAFFQRNAEHFRTFAQGAVPVCNTCVKTHSRMVDTGEERNKNQIARTAFSTTLDGTAYLIPGSALKGILHTALLNRVNGGYPKRETDDLDAVILGGTFSNSPMRYLKVSDLVPAAEVPARIIQAVRCYKGDGEGLKGSGGIPAAFEVIERGVYRTFQGEIALTTPTNDANVEHRYVYRTPQDIVRDLNAYYQPLLARELRKYELLPEGRAWSARVRQLLLRLQDQLAEGHLALARIGKNVGAESIVLAGDIASIHGKSGKITTKTEWRIRDRETLPFGWCLLEFGNLPENAAIKDFCQAQPATQIVDLTKVKAVRQAMEEKARRQHEADLARLQAEKEAQEKAAAAEAAESARRATLSPEALLLEDMVTKMTQCAGDIKPGQALFNEVWDFLQRTLQWEASLQKQVAATIAPLAKKKNMYQGKKEKELKALFRTLRQE